MLRFITVITRLRDAAFCGSPTCEMSRSSTAACLGPYFVGGPHVCCGPLHEVLLCDQPPAAFPAHLVVAGAKSFCCCTWVLARSCTHPSCLALFFYLLPSVT